MRDVSEVGRILGDVAGRSVVTAGDRILRRGAPPVVVEHRACANHVLDADGGSRVGSIVVELLHVLRTVESSARLVGTKRR